MGYRVAWIARAGSSTQELLEVAQRKPTGERHEFPDVGWYLLEMPNAAENPWVVLIADGSENYGELYAELAQGLSQYGNETLFFWCSDTVMVTELMGFNDGRPTWSIAYSCEAAEEDEDARPELEGTMPAIALEVVAELQAKQRADIEGSADYLYDVTAEVGRRLVGFRHDVDLKLDDPEPFQVLGEASKRKPAWWQVWKR